jgi:D-sedoheptulose 7-phosphate isomerase
MEYINKVRDALSLIDEGEIARVVHLIKNCKGNIFVFGNGGSGATASHFTQDMNKKTDSKFICLNDNVASILAIGNDDGFENVFKFQLKSLLQKDDMVIGISCSGNSPNIIVAIIYAKHFGHLTIGISGFDGGELRHMVDHSIHVPSKDMQVCEDLHLVICHTIMRLSC